MRRRYRRAVLHDRRRRGAAGPVRTERVIAKGDLVAVNSHYTTAPNTRGRAVIDPFRVRDQKIVEHWLSAQDVPATSANDNTMF
jgi:predicted SnoaL-like aldol condensation-catalyzing enzyme